MNPVVQRREPRLPRSNGGHRPNATSPERHLGLLILVPGSFHPIASHPQVLPCCHGNNRIGARGSWLLCTCLSPAWPVCALLTTTLHAQHLVTVGSSRSRPWPTHFKQSSEFSASGDAALSTSDTQPRWSPNLASHRAFPCFI